VERLVIDRLRAFLTDPAAVLDAIDSETASGSGQGQLVEHGRQAAEELGNRPPNEVKATLVALACRVVISFDLIEINISRYRLAAFLAGQSIDPAIQKQKLGLNSDNVVTLAAPARLKRVGREMRMLVENSNDQAAADPSLLRIIARAHDIQERLSQNPKLTVMTSPATSASRRPTSTLSCVFPGWRPTSRRPSSTAS
jgi:site-specific DNA recombinase